MEEYGCVGFSCCTGAAAPSLQSVPVFQQLVVLSWGRSAFVHKWAVLFIASPKEGRIEECVGVPEETFVRVSVGG